MLPPDYHVICVGCGPAGNLASYLLATKGYRVLMVEKEPLPRRKACGGGLTGKALACLPYDVSAVLHYVVGEAYVHIGPAGPFHLVDAGLGAMVERSEFDAFMAAKAQLAGATLVCGEEVLRVLPEASQVVLETATGSFSAHVLIGADGANSRVRQLVFPGYRPLHAFGIEATYHWRPEVPPNPLVCGSAMLDFDAVGRGYGWIFPKRDHFNAGIYRISKEKQQESLKKLLMRFEQNYPLLGDCAATPPVGHPIPVADGSQPVESGRILLIGDAAMLGEAVFGEGIAFALQSGVIAAEWIEASLREGRFSPRGRFRAALQPLITELSYSYWIAKVMYWLPRFLLERVAASRGVQALMVRLMTGECTYRAAFWRLAYLLPVALLSPKSSKAPEFPFAAG
jgi:geranylgeranyl reductase family protein